MKLHRMTPTVLTIPIIFLLSLMAGFMTVQPVAAVPATLASLSLQTDTCGTEHAGETLTPFSPDDCPPWALCPQTVTFTPNIDIPTCSFGQSLEAMITAIPDNSVGDIQSVTAILKTTTTTPIQTVGAASLLLQNDGTWQGFMCLNGFATSQPLEITLNVTGKAHWPLADECELAEQEHLTFGFEDVTIQICCRDAACRNTSPPNTTIPGGTTQIGPFCDVVGMGNCFASAAACPSGLGGTPQTPVGYHKVQFEVENIGTGDLVLQYWWTFIKKCSTQTEGPFNLVLPEDEVTTICFFVPIYCVNDKLRFLDFLVLSGTESVSYIGAGCSNIAQDECHPSTWYDHPRTGDCGLGFDNDLCDAVNDGVCDECPSY